jgi:flagellar hook-associated protein 1 FlgK
MDLLANKSIRSGTIAAYAEMRDEVLPAFQTQLDAIAAGMASALSDKSVAGTPASSGGQNGFDLDLSGLQPGNSVRVTYTDVATNTQRTVTLVRVDDPAALPLDDDATADPNDRVVGINFSGGMGSVATQIGAALGANFTVSAAGSTLRVLDDGGATVAMQAMTATQTTTALAGGDVALPMFTDGGRPYSGAINANGAQMIGLAGRITVNAALVADPSKLVFYGAGVTAGDTTRPDFILAQLTQTTLTFPSQTGIGSAATPFQGTISGFLQQVLTTQGAAAANASALAQGQDVVVNALKQRASETSGVNIDEELAHLLQLQSAYAANARVMSAVKDMLDLLSKI